MNPLLKPGPAAAVGAIHNQLATGLPNGGLVLSCHKVVEEGARALILLAPGLFRLDVRPVEDTLEVMTRALGPAPGRWETESAAAPGSETNAGEPPHRVRWRGRFDTRPRPIVVTVLLQTTLTEDAGSRHFAAHAVARETD